MRKFVNISKVLFLLGIFALCISCNNRENRFIGKQRVSGRVVNRITGKPMPNLVIDLMFVPSGFHKQQWSGKKTSTTTDINGNYQLAFDFFSKETYGLYRVLKPEDLLYYNQTYCFSIEDFKKEGYATNDSILPLKFADITLVNKNKYAQRDTIEVMINAANKYAQSVGYPGYENYFPLGPFQIVSPSIFQKTFSAVPYSTFEILLYENVGTTKNLFFQAPLNVNYGDTGKFTFEY